MYILYPFATFLALVSALPSTKPKPKPLPLIVWHGLGDRYDADGLQSTGELAQEVHPGTYVYYIRTDEDGGNDRTNTFFGNVTTQLEEVCEAIHKEPGLLHPDDRQWIRVDALGFSQGGQFLRGLIERCDRLSVRSLVTFGSQHNGIAEFQQCGTFDFLCKGATGLIKGNAWTDYVQGKVVPAQYYRTVNETTGQPTEDYLAHSNFLADINNERKEKNEVYAKKIAALEKFVMYVFKEDVTVVPKETGWFAEVNATSGEVTPLRERTLYKEDWLGLQRLDKKGGLVFKSTTGKHMELSDKDLRDAFAEYFGPERASEDEEFPGYQDFVQAAFWSAKAGERGDLEQKKLLVDEANRILEQIRADGWVEQTVDAQWVADWEEGEEGAYSNLDWECAAGQAQVWWDSLSWWEKRKFEWEAVWLPWWRGEAERLSGVEKRLKAKGDL
jgi:palmitoyl-protein thioesterase